MTPTDPMDAATERELAAVDAALAGRDVDPDLADVAELTRALRDTRPEPAAGFSRDMDTWARAGFTDGDPRRPRTPARWRRVLRGPALGGLVAAAAAVGLGIAVIPQIPNGSDEEGGSAAGGSAAQSAPSPSPTRESESEQSGSRDASGGSARRSLRSSAAKRYDPNALQPLAQSAQPARRQVELSAALALAARPAELEEVAAGVARVTDPAGGYVARSTVEAAPEGGAANFELRVPSRKLTQVLADLSELASVRSRSQSTVDITRTVRSAAERIEEYRAERRGLLRRLATSPTPQLRERLRFVSAELRRAERDLASAERRADLARVSVSIQGDPEAGGAGAAGDGRWTPGDAIRDAGRLLEVIAGIALIALAIALPLALLAVPLAVLARRQARRGRERALDAV